MEVLSPTSIFIKETLGTLVKETLKPVGGKEGVQGVDCAALRDVERGGLDFALQQPVYLPPQLPHLHII